jgi:hypothetical protein
MDGVGREATQMVRALDEGGLNDVSHEPDVLGDLRYRAPVLDREDCCAKEHGQQYDHP